MTTILFDVTAFRGLYPSFADPSKYSDALLQQYWTRATMFISDQNSGCYCGAFTIPQQTVALQDMTAHMLTLRDIAAAGGTAGIMTGATIDKVSVQVEPPPHASQIQYWLNQTPFGQAVWALFSFASIGGFYVAGGPNERRAYRKAYGVF